MTEAHFLWQAFRSDTWCRVWRRVLMVAVVFAALDAITTVYLFGVRLFIVGVGLGSLSVAALSAWALQRAWSRLPSGFQRLAVVLCPVVGVFGGYWHSRFTSSVDFPISLTVLAIAYTLAAFALAWGLVWLSLWIADGFKQRDLR